MMSLLYKVARTLVLVTVLMVVSAPARAHFERPVLSARLLSLGGAFVAVADDPTATTINPAGLTNIPYVSLLASLSQPYGIDDLQEHYLGVSVPARYVTVGVSWHRFALRDALSEDLISIGVGRDLIRTSQDASLSIGASLDIARVSAEDGFDVTQTKVTGGLSVLLRPFPVIGVGYTLRNIGEPQFDLVAGGGRTKLRTEQAIGLAAYWRRFFVVNYQVDRGQEAVWRQRVGLELKATDNLSLRAGLRDGEVSGGIGLSVSRVYIDAGVSSHDTLGLTYLLSVGFRWKRPSEVPQW
jgi:hypothetical protein